MKRRFASHFLYVAGYGYLRMHVVEVEDGVPVAIYPLSGETEATEWLPGVIALLDAMPEEEDALLPAVVSDALPSLLNADLSCFALYWFTPFDMETLRPVAGTRHKRLL